MQAPAVHQRTLSSFDGTRIAYQVSGSGPAIILSNGLGGTFSTWRHQYALLGDRYKIISWDYRGLFRSGRPVRLETVALEKQAKDLELILEAEQVEQAVFFGWSMGVQVNFEYYRQHAEQFAGIVVLNGVAGKPFATAFGSGFARYFLPLGVGLLKAGAALVSTGSQLAVRWKGLVPLLQRVGMVAPSLDTEVFYDLALDYSKLDFVAYGETFRALGEHDATDLLHRIHVPVLIVTGTRDLFTPLATAEEMARSIPRAELVPIDGATHYAAVEYPREVNERIRTFLKAIRYGELP